ncbi:hypothetical protein L9F63_016651, partial [Diploptera punctata]
IRAPLRSATTSSGYDSYHSPHRRCYMLHTLRRAAVTNQSHQPVEQKYHYNFHCHNATNSTRVPTTVSNNNRYL